MPRGEGAPVKDMTGQKFGRLQVHSYAGYGRWNCVCSCGAWHEVIRSALIDGLTQSCGCLNQERRIAKAKYGVSVSRIPEYFVWSMIVQRCTNRRNKDWRRYGGRGITVCKRWRKFAGFFSDMGRRPSPQHTLERRNNDQGYSPKNCYWASRYQQMNNRSNNVVLEHDGFLGTRAEWARRLNMSYFQLRDAMRRGKTLTEIVNERQNAHG